MQATLSGMRVQHPLFGTNAHRAAGLGYYDRRSRYFSRAGMGGNHVITALIDQQHRLQQAGSGVETRRNSRSGGPSSCRLAPQRPLCRLDRIFRGDALLGCARVDLYAV